MVKVTPKQLTNSKFRADIQNNEESEGDGKEDMNEDQVIDDET